jgi:hypothetical protein
VVRAVGESLLDFRGRLFAILCRTPLPGKTAAVVALTLGVVLSGAVGVTAQLLRRPQRCGTARVAVHAWGCEVVSGMPAEARRQWRGVLEEDPSSLLRLCSLTLPPAGVPVDD